MREKAAARKQLEAAADSTSAKVAALFTNSKKQHATIAAMAPTAPSVPSSTASVVDLTESEPDQEEKPTAAPMPSKKSEETPAKESKTPPKPLLSPLDTYEISDREEEEDSEDEESESESESESEGNSRKKVSSFPAVFSLLCYS